MERPAGKIRRSQLLTAYGPGAMVDLVDHAVLVSGLDDWRVGRNPPAVSEPRLRDVIAERLAQTNSPLRTENAFLRPPEGDDDRPSVDVGIPALVFPRWFVCQGCRALLRADSLELKSERYVHTGCSRKRGGIECVPVRFVAACQNGHLADFPWRAFVHRKLPEGARCPGISLRLLEGASGDFSEIVVQCDACGSKASMKEALVKSASVLPKCPGRRPWLGVDAEEVGCTAPQRLLVRTASNSYFPLVESALSIPDNSHKLDSFVVDLWDVLETANAQTLPVFRQIPKMSTLADFSDEEILAVVEARRSGRAPDRERLRTAEFRTLCAQPTERPGDRAPEGETFYARRLAEERLPEKAPMPSEVERVVLAHRLRQVRVQVGFTRLEPSTANLQGEYDLGVATAPLGHHTDWLPAVELHGEGIFIQLAEEAVRAWERRPEVMARGEALRLGYRSYQTDDSGRENTAAPPFPGVRFYLLHSLSHLLLSAISIECGYSASALSERIYCAPQSDPTPMAGILITTGTPGTEGTLGGLVEQGRKVTQHLRRAWRMGRLCSGDPVCAAHDPAEDPAERFLEGAACHGCLFVAECSCERFNRYLDRALVVPTLGQPPELAFFRECP